VRDHATDRPLDKKLGMPLAARGEALGLMASYIARETHIRLLDILFSSNAHLLCIDDDDEITSVHVRREDRLAFATKQVGGLYRHMAEMLVCRVDDPPVALNIGRLC
jgi:hypothetical protein